MKTKPSVSEPAAPAETTTKTAAPESAQIAVEIPPEIHAYAQIDAQWDQLTAAIADAEALAVEAQDALDKELPVADLRDDQTIVRISQLQAQATLAPRRATALNEQIKSISKLLSEARTKAAQTCLGMLMEIVQANIEILARQVAEHFDSMDDAREAVSEGGAVKQWNTIIANLRWEQPDGQKTMETARKACAELARVRALLSAAPAAEEATPAASK